MESPVKTESTAGLASHGENLCEGKRNTRDKMHIGFLTNEYPPLPSGGIGTSVQNLARQFVSKGHRVTVLGWGAKKEFEDLGVQVRFIGGTNIPKMGWLFNRLHIQREFNHLVKRENIEIVEAPDWCGPSAGIRLNCPIVIRCHGSATYFASLLGESVKPAVRICEQMALKGAASVAAVSKFTAQNTERLFSLDNKVRVITNGIDLTKFRPSENEPTEPDTILYFGTLVRKKGVLDLCRIFSEVIEKYPKAKLKIIGKDSEDKKTGAKSTWTLCQQLLTNRAKKSTEYLGMKPYNEVQNHIRQAALCVFPSYAEAMPLAWLEAMACAKAIVVYDIGWASEVIENLVDGVLVAKGNISLFADEIIKLLSIDNYRYRLAQAARLKIVNNFSTEINALKSIEWYKNSNCKHN